MKFRKTCEQLVFLFLLLLVSTGNLHGQITLAIADFTNRTDHIYLDSWERKIPEFLQSELSQSREIVLVERQNLKSILDEHALSMSGLIDSAAQEVGKLLSARYMITGSIYEAGDWLRIDARIINVSTGKVVSEKVQSKDQNQLDKMVHLLANNLQYQLTGSGTYQSKISLKKCPVSYFLIGTLGSGLATLIVHNQYLKKQDEYRQVTKLESFDSAYDSANHLYQARTILISVTGAGLAGTLYCWLRNLSPEEILASQPTVLPYVMSTEEGEFAVGVHITF
jgi:TolB-like protein